LRASEYLSNLETSIGGGKRINKCERLKREIAEALNQLDEKGLSRALEIVCSLSGGLPKGMSGKDFVKIAGSIPPEDIEEMAKAIEEAFKCPPLHEDLK